MFHMTVALNVTDEATYQSYRDGMTPILDEMGGRFSYDFRIAETLKSRSDHPITRVFVISFPDEATSSSFFADERYGKVRAEYFDPSTDGFTLIGQFETET